MTLVFSSPLTLSALEQKEQRALSLTDKHIQRSDMEWD